MTLLSYVCHFQARFAEDSASCKIIQWGVFSSLRRGGKTPIASEPTQSVFRQVPFSEARCWLTHWLLC